MAISPRPPAVVEAVEEIMRTYRSLPPRPTIEEVEGATAVLTSSNCEEDAKIEELSRKGKPIGVPDELFFVLQEVKRNAVQLLAIEQRREALRVLDLDRRFRVLEELIQKASKLVSDEDGDEKEDNRKPIVGLSVPLPMIGPSLVTMEKEAKGGSDLPKELDRGSSLKSEIPSG